MTEERKKLYIKLIKESHSFREVCFKAGISVTTGNYDTLKKIVKESNIDISHFKRCSYSGNKKPTKFVTKDVIENKVYLNAARLKERLIKEKIKEEKCEKCGNTEWLGEKIPLQLHHIDGNKYNNELKNLQLLCPNCHSLTENWCGKNTKKIRHCKVCDNEIKDGKSLYCSKECEYKDRFNKKIGVVTKEILISILKESETLKEVSLKIERTPRNLRRLLTKYNINWKEFIKKENSINEIIETLITTKNFTKTGKIFSISDNGIRKKLKSNGYSTNLNELINQYYKQ